MWRAPASHTPCWDCDEPTQDGRAHRHWHHMVPTLVNPGDGRPSALEWEGGVRVSWRSWAPPGEAGLLLEKLGSREQGVISGPTPEAQLSTGRCRRTDTRGTRKIVCRVGSRVRGGRATWVWHSEPEP